MGKSKVKDKNLYNKMDAARVLGIDHRTLDKLVASGKVEAVTDVYDKKKFNRDYIDALAAKWMGSNEK